MRSVLLIGTFPELLRTRREAFEKASYRVFALRSVPDDLGTLTSLNVDAVVLGHAVTHAERRKICRALKRHRPETRIVVLYLGSISGVELADAVLNVTGSVADLVTAVNELLAQRQHRRRLARNG